MVLFYTIYCCIHQVMPKLWFDKNLILSFGDKFYILLLPSILTLFSIRMMCTQEINGSSTTCQKLSNKIL